MQARCAARGSSVNGVSRTLALTLTTSHATTFFSTVRFHVTGAPTRTQRVSKRTTDKHPAGHHGHRVRRQAPEVRRKTRAAPSASANRTMESVVNGSDADYRSQLPLLYHNNSICRNFTEGNNTTSFAEARCEEDPMDDDTNPVIIAIIITALYSIVCVVGLVGNVLVMYIIVR